MKCLIMLVVVLILLGSVELFAQIQYNFEFDMVGVGVAWLKLEIKETYQSQWELEREWTVIVLPDTRYHSMILDFGNQLHAVRVTAGTFPHGASFREIRTNLGYNNYFFIDLSPPVNPTSDPPCGGDE
ncbi:MAG: hypothetical protein K0B81_01120 [Candidatus Cloacimonetes bacterium]|nr:hypothetical protein [Candidatus Cloacimonadota bacterium]